MDSPFDDVYSRLLSEQSKVKQTVEQVIQLNTPEILTLVKNRLKYGQGVNGGVVGTYRSSEYSAFKSEMNPLAGSGNVDLFLTGALQDNLIVKQESNLFRIYSTDSKYNELAKKYGAEQFGLTQEQLIEFLYECYLISLELIINRSYGK